MGGASSNFETPSWQFSVGLVLIKQTSKYRKLLNRQTKSETEEKNVLNFVLKTISDGSFSVILWA